MTEKEIPFNAAASNELFNLDFTTATVADIQKLMSRGASLHITLNGYKKDVFFSESILDKAIGARNVTITAFLVAENVKAEYQADKLTGLSFLIENGIKKVENPLIEYSKVAHNTPCFTDEYLPLLRKHGKAFLNKQDKDGKTALMHLIDRSHKRSYLQVIDVLETVIQEHHYDYTLHDDYGQNLLSYVHQCPKPTNVGYKGYHVIHQIEQKTLAAYQDKKQVVSKNQKPVNPNESQHTRV